MTTKTKETKVVNVLDDIDDTPKRAPMTVPEVTSAVIINAAKPYNSTDPKHGDLEELISSLMKVNKSLIDKDNPNQMKEAERLLMSQSQALNAMFCNLVGRAQSQTNMDNIDKFMKLAFKAQSQCRATLETLSNIKNPPVIFAKTANIAQNQQINNGAPPAQSIKDALTHEQGEPLPTQSTLKQRVTS